MKLFRAVAPVYCMAFMVTALMAQRAPVNLGTAGNYVILSKTGITDVPPSPIVGNIGASPISGAAIGVTCSEVTGTISAVDAAGPAPCSLVAPGPLGVAVLDMQNAYTNAAGRTIPDFTELGAGNISGMTLAPGLYKWSTDVMMDATGVTLSGGPNAVWIFQISGDLRLANGGHVNLAGGARAVNVFWQVGGPTAVTIGTTAVFAGNILSAKQVIMLTGATLTGRALAFTQVTLQSNHVTTPGNLVGGVPVLVAPTVTSTTPANLATGVAISSPLTATFSEAMNPATINTSTFTLKQGVTPVAGAVTYSGVTATFAPSAALAVNTAYTATITTGAADPAGDALAANYVWTFTTAASGSTTPPTVISTIPASGAANVPLGNPLSATFSAVMNPATITTASFTLQQGNTAIPGAVSYAGTTATFTPTSPLALNSVYTATITTAATDLAGNALASNYAWSFTTGATPITGPAVTSTVPSNGASGVSTGISPSANFNEAMNPATITAATFSLTQGGAPVAGTVSYTGVTATFTPQSPLAANSQYTATIFTGAADVAGIALAGNYVWSFTTGTGPLTVPPIVISTVPTNGATLVTLSTNVLVNFSHVMNPSSINTTSFTLQQGTTLVPGTIIYAGTAVTFRPANNLLPNTVYTGTITTGASDMAGVSLAANYTWSFTTGTGAVIAPVCLANFAVLSGSSIVNVGATAVTGDIGVSPGTSITGFPPGTLTGAMHAGDTAASQGITDLATAYGQAVSLSAGAVPVSGDLGGQTLTPGIYESESSLNITSADLTLDAKGNANAVFIFQMASTFMMASGRQVLLTGGATGANVFWQVGGSAILGSNSVLQGSILAAQSITLNTGATVNGRLLAQNGAVMLQSNTITSPAPVIAYGQVLNGASDGRTVAAGGIASVFGNNLGGSLLVAAGYPLPLPTTLGGSSFQVGTQNAPLYMTSCSQANLQIPWETPTQAQVSVSATVGGVVSAQQPVTVAQFAPGVFSMDQTGSGQGAVEIVPTSQLAMALGAAGRPVQRGEYIAIFATGLGPVTNQPATGAAALSSPLSSTLTLPTVTIGGVPAPVTYSGLAPGFAGLYQVNVLVPSGAVSGNSIELALSIGGVQANVVTIAVQ